MRKLTCPMFLTEHFLLNGFLGQISTAMHLIPQSVDILFRTNSELICLKIMALIQPTRSAFYTINCKLLRNTLKRQSFWTGSQRVHRIC